MSTTAPAAAAAPSAAPAPNPPASVFPSAPSRLVSLDAYRGFIMLAMASAGLGLADLARRRDAAGLGVSPLLRWLGFQTDHVEWVGCSFWDLIQPSFMFMVGVALPYSVASRVARGDTPLRRHLSAAWRALLLVLLGVFLMSPQPRVTSAGPTTNWIFTNVLSQIGLGYFFVYLLAGRGLAAQLAALAAVLAGCTLAFGLFPAPGPDYPWAAVGVPRDWPHPTGWFAHWDKNSNLAHFFDVWLLNLFPRVEPYRFEPGGYETLNFVPSMATMILGLIAGEKLRSGATKAHKLLWLAGVGVACLAAGLAMGAFVCPIVKRIWTPSWAVYSAGWTFLMLALFFAVIDVAGWKAWAFPLVVVGMNSIAMYFMSMQMKPWVRDKLRVHFATGRLDPLGEQPVVVSAATLFVLWLFCLWLYRRRIFIRL